MKTNKKLKRSEIPTLIVGIILIIAGIIYGVNYGINCYLEAVEKSETKELQDQSLKDIHTEDFLEDFSRVIIIIIMTIGMSSLCAIPGIVVCILSREVSSKPYFYKITNRSNENGS